MESRAPERAWSIALLILVLGNSFACGDDGSLVPEMLDAGVDIGADDVIAVDAVLTDGPSDGGARDASSDADAGDDPLWDPMRPTLSYECAGTELTGAELYSVIGPGYGWLTYNREPHVMQVVSYSRTCAEAGDCTSWRAQPDTSEVGFTLVVLPGGTTAVTPFEVTSLDARSRDMSELGPFTTYETGGIRIGTGSWGDARLRWTNSPGDDYCVSLASVVTTMDVDGATEESFAVGKTIAPLANPESISPDDPPEWTFPEVCADAPASDADIRRIWLSGTETRRAVIRDSNRAGSRSETALRRCQVSTGCRPWRTISFPFVPDELADESGRLFLRFDTPDGEVDLPITDGYFEGLVGTAVVDGLVGSNCMYVRTDSTQVEGFGQEEHNVSFSVIPSD